MSGSKQQVLYVGGGDSFSSREDFLRFLKEMELRDPRGEGSKRWTKTLRDDLGKDFDLFQLSMPCSDNAKYDEWKVWFERHFEFVKDGAILIGWSLGGMFLLKYLSEEMCPFKFKKLFSLSSPAGSYETDHEPGNDCKTFAFDLEKLPKILDKVEYVTLMHSTDDFVVPYDHALKLKAALPEAELVTFEDRNHFLQEEFPELIEKVKELAGE